MIAFNLLFLIGRFYLRLRPRSPARNRHDDIDSPEPEASAKPRQEPPKSRLKPSDYLLVLAFVAIFFQALLLTKANVVETLIRDKNPSVPMYMDPVVFYRLSEQDQVVYTNNYIQVLRIPFSTRLKVTVRSFFSRGNC